MTRHVAVRTFANAAAAMTVARSASVFAASTEAPRPWEAAPREGFGASQWRERHARLAADVARRQSRVIFFGDSLFERFASTGAQSWRARFTDTDAMLVATNGDTTQDALWHIDHNMFDDAAPRTVVVLIGTNDLPHFPPRDCARGIAAVVDRLRERVPSAKILLLGLLPRYDSPVLHAGAVAVNAILAAKNFDTRVHFRDIGMHVAGQEPQPSRAYDSDALHLTAVGYARLADAISAELF